MHCKESRTMHSSIHTPILSRNKWGLQQHIQWQQKVCEPLKMKRS